MPRITADLRISLKRRGGKTRRVELIRNPFAQRFGVRVDGKNATKLPEATATDIAELHPTVDRREPMTAHAGNRTII